MQLNDVITQLRDFTLKVVPDLRLNDTIKKGIFPEYGSGLSYKELSATLHNMENRKMDFTQLNEIIVHVFEATGGDMVIGNKDEQDNYFGKTLFPKTLQILESFDKMQNENLNISACAILKTNFSWRENQKAFGYGYTPNPNYLFLIRFDEHGLEKSDDVLNLLFETDLERSFTLIDLVSDSSIREDIERELPINKFLLDWWTVLPAIDKLEEISHDSKRSNVTHDHQDPYYGLDRDEVIRRDETSNEREQGIGHQSHKHAYVNEFQVESDLYFWESLAQWIFMFQDHSRSDLLPNEFMTKFMSMVARDIFHLDEHMVIKVRRHTYNNVSKVHLTSSIQAQYQHGHIYILYKDMPNLQTFHDYEKIVKECGVSLDPKTCFVYVGLKKPKLVRDQTFITRDSFQDAVQMFYGNESSSPPQEPSTDHRQEVSHDRKHLLIPDAEPDAEEEFQEEVAEEMEKKPDRYAMRNESARRLGNAYRVHLAKKQFKEAREDFAHAEERARAQEHAREERARAEEHARDEARAREGSARVLRALEHEVLD